VPGAESADCRTESAGQAYTRMGYPSALYSLFPNQLAIPRRARIFSIRHHLVMLD
jgi:hypothetical protein